MGNYDYGYSAGYRDAQSDMSGGGGPPTNIVEMIGATLMAAAFFGSMIVGVVYCEDIAKYLIKKGIFK